MPTSNGWDDLEAAANASELGERPPTAVESLQYARCLARPALLPNIRLPLMKDGVDFLVHLATTDKLGRMNGELVSMRDRNPILQTEGILTNPAKCKFYLYF